MLDIEAGVYVPLSPAPSSLCDIAMAMDRVRRICCSISRLAACINQAQEAARNAALPALLGPLKYTTRPNWRATCNSPRKICRRQHQLVQLVGVAVQRLFIERVYIVRETGQVQVEYRRGAVVLLPRLVSLRVRSRSMGRASMFRASSSTRCGAAVRRPGLQGQWIVRGCRVCWPVVG